MRDIVLPGPIRQIGYVVRDFDRAVASWLALGVGPWYVIRGQHQRVLYRGRPSEVTLSVGFANSGELQIEVIHQEDDTPSIFTEFLSSGREGFHQFAWWADNFDEAVRNATAVGWPVVFSGGADEGTRFAYLESAGGPAAVFEVMERTDATVAMAQLVRDAADGWDGSDPVRVLRGG
ncbi:VOC family protein [Mycobacterium botniense]|uniref:Glyoxalase n=1 Tax=Mycobacterium botniense TaxID=84962 RepID=A0A7I9XXL2_9MYCO|nr:VOC family protein [Mycobacterium botniense]GFG74520.1 glyoxalase [Mycobacterium botniense]